MSDESKHTTSSTIVTNRYIKERLPNDFDVNEIGDIDLIEAEKIANEDIVLLSEQDLLADLEGLDLAPLDDFVAEVQQQPSSPVTQGPAAREVEYSKVVEPAVQDYVTEKPVAEESVVEEIVAEKPVEKPVLKDKSVIEKKVPQEGPIDESVKEEPLVEAVEFNETELLTDSQPFSETVTVESAKKATSTESKEELDINDSGVEIEYFNDFIDFYNQEDLVPETKKTTTPTKIPDKKEVPLETFTTENKEIKRDGRKETVEPESAKTGKVVPEKETAESREVKFSNESVLIIEDFGDDGVQIATKEATEHFDIIPVSDSISLIEDDLRYIDEDIDFVHTAIVQDDYIDYIQNIDEFYDDSGEKSTAKAIEIFGFTLSEIEEMQDALFQREYSGVELGRDLQRVNDGLEETRGVFAKHKNITYIIPDRDSLNTEEKKSIEANILADLALVYVEDINKIKELLLKTGRSVDDELLTSEREDTEKQKEGAEQQRDIVSAGQMDEEAPLFDITDKVVIIEDELDVDRFVKEFPVNKQTEVQKLLKYLDGLFEKLPRSTLRNFIDSEYFDLYIKVLTRMGI